MERWRVEQVEEEQRVAESCEVEQRAVMLAMEQCWVPLEAMMPQASPSKVAMKQAEWTPRVVFPEKSCARCDRQEVLCLCDLDWHTWACQLCRELKKPC